MDFFSASDPFFGFYYPQLNETCFCLAIMTQSVLRYCCNYCKNRNQVLSSRQQFDDNTGKNNPNINSKQNMQMS